MMRYVGGLSILVMAGCAIPLRNGDDAPALGRKQVTQKIMPDTLVAWDGTRCQTTAGKFRKTDLRTDAWCIWQVPPRHGSSAALR